MTDTARRLAYGDVIWYRPDEGLSRTFLLDVPRVAAIAGCSENTVGTWKSKNPDTYPKPVMAVIGPAAVPRYYYLPEEIIDWLIHHRPGVKPEQEKARLRQVITDMEAHLDKLAADIANIRYSKACIEGAVMGKNH